MSFITVGHCAAASRASAANGIWPLPSCVTPSWLSSMTANLFRETHCQRLNVQITNGLDRLPEISQKHPLDGVE